MAGVKQVVAFTSEAAIGLDAADGKLLWRSPVKTTFSRHIATPVAFGDMVVVSSHEAGLLGFRVTPAADGLKAERAWVRKDLAINFSSPVLVGQFLYGLGSEEEALLPGRRDGPGQWVQDQRVASPAAFVSLLVMKDNLFVLGDSGKPISLPPTPRIVA